MNVADSGADDEQVNGPHPGGRVTQTPVQEFHPPAGARHIAASVEIIALGHAEGSGYFSVASCAMARMASFASASESPDARRWTTAAAYARIISVVGVNS